MIRLPFADVVAIQRSTDAHRQPVNMLSRGRTRSEAKLQYSTHCVACSRRAHGFIPVADVPSKYQACAAPLMTYDFYGLWRYPDGLYVS